ncbi:[LysW]-aminoadipate kinase [Halolamina litorea]|uniref:Putative [LysW]-aminoadipate/[LysW]-glutamate kinase n=1 Tax=Halolamina litorea TaxID=1515593 RepID=A0ABD6BRK9_9EURY|nr:acetylglutamate/acetylaminoadipate kinase [Halolamina litorea]
MSESNAAVGPDQPPLIVKIGGARAVDPAGVIEDVAHVVAAGREVVVVHGGSTAVDDTLEAMGKEPEYVTTPSGVSGRFTDEETMGVFSMVLPGKLNTELVTDLRAAGVNAVGLSGVDGGLVTGPRKSAVRVLEDGKKKIRRGDHAGKPEAVNAGLLSSLLSDGYVPTVSPPMLADDGTAVNADADRVAALLAAELGGELVLLTDVEGVYADPEDPDTLIDAASTPAEFAAVEDAAEGFMSRKVHAAEEALSGGATGVVISDAGLRKPLLAALDGHGTWIDQGAVGGGNAEADGADDTAATADGGDAE